MNRRELLRSAAIAPVLATLAGCKYIETHLTPQAIPAEVQKASALVANVGPAVQALVRALGSVIPAKVQAEVQTYSTDIIGVAQQLSSAATAQAGASLVNQLIGLASQVDDALGQVPGLAAQTVGGITVGTILGAAKVALAAAAALFGTPPAVASARMGAAPAMPPEVAQQILATVAAK